jgi:hypothetical protein
VVSGEGFASAARFDHPGHARLSFAQRFFLRAAPLAAPMQRSTKSAAMAQARPSLTAHSGIASASARTPAASSTSRATRPKAPDAWCTTSARAA